MKPPNHTPLATPLYIPSHLSQTFLSANLVPLYSLRHPLSPAFPSRQPVSITYILLACSPLPAAPSLSQHERLSPIYHVNRLLLVPFLEFCNPICSLLWRTSSSMARYSWSPIPEQRTISSPRKSSTSEASYFTTCANQALIHSSFFCSYPSRTRPKRSSCRCGKTPKA